MKIVNIKCFELLEKILTGFWRWCYRDLYIFSYFGRTADRKKHSSTGVKCARRILFLVFAIVVRLLQVAGFHVEHVERLLV